MSQSRLKMDSGNVMSNSHLVPTSVLFGNSVLAVIDSHEDLQFRVYFSYFRSRFLQHPLRKKRGLKRLDPARAIIVNNIMNKCIFIISFKTHFFHSIVLLSATILNVGTYVQNSWTCRNNSDFMIRFNI